MAQSPDAREGQHIEAVLRRIQAQGFAVQVVDRVTGGVDEAEDPPTAPVTIVNLGRCEILEDLAGIPALLGQFSDGEAHGAGRSGGPDDGLGLGVGKDTEVAPVSTHAAHLEAAEGRLVVSLGGIDPDMPCLEALGHIEGAPRVG